MSATPLPSCLLCVGDRRAIRPNEPVVQLAHGIFPPEWEGIFVEEIGKVAYVHKGCFRDLLSRATGSPDDNTEGDPK